MCLIRENQRIRNICTGYYVCIYSRRYIIPRLAEFADKRNRVGRNVQVAKPLLVRCAKTFHNRDVEFLRMKLFQSKWPVILCELRTVSTSRLIILFFLLFFFVRVKKVCRLGNPVWSTSKGGRFHGKISCV